jgi:hypothetical protein
MCGLCGALGGENHWTAGHTLDPEQATHQRRRERTYRIALINRVLSPSRVTVRDFQGSSYVVATATGQEALASDLGEIWAQIRAMTGRSPDPLTLKFGEAEVP